MALLLFRRWRDPKQPLLLVLVLLLLLLDRLTSLLLLSLLLSICETSWWKRTNDDMRRRRIGAGRDGLGLSECSVTWAGGVTGVAAVEDSEDEPGPDDESCDDDGGKDDDGVGAMLVWLLCDVGDGGDLMVTEPRRARLCAMRSPGHDDTLSAAGGMLVLVLPTVVLLVGVMLLWLFSALGCSEALPPLLQPRADAAPPRMLVSPSPPPLLLVEWLIVTENRRF